MTTTEVEVRPIPGFPEYLASSDGSIYGTARNTTRGGKLSPWPQQGGRNLVVVLSINGARYTQRVRRLIAVTFLGEQPPGTALVNLDDDPANNAVDNLAYRPTKASQVGPHNRDKTHCPKNHPLSGDNLASWGPSRRCRTCLSEQRRNGKKPPRKTHCPKNHPFTADNTYLIRGRPRCRRCVADRKAARES